MYQHTLAALLSDDEEEFNVDGIEVKDMDDDVSDDLDTIPAKKPKAVKAAKPAKAAKEPTPEPEEEEEEAADVEMDDNDEQDQEAGDEDDDDEDEDEEMYVCKAATKIHADFTRFAVEKILAHAPAQNVCR